MSTHTITLAAVTNPNYTVGSRVAMMVTRAICSCGAAVGSFYTHEDNEVTGKVYRCENGHTR